MLLYTHIVARKEVFVTRYIAIESPYTMEDARVMLNRTVNRLSVADIRRSWKIIGIGDDLEREPIVALREKIQKRYRNKHGNGASYKRYMNQVRFITVQEGIRKFPHLRDKLKWYDMKYYEWRIKVEEDKMKQKAKQKEGVRFIDYAG